MHSFYGPSIFLTFNIHTCTSVTFYSRLKTRFPLSQAQHFYQSLLSSVFLYFFTANKIKKFASATTSNSLFKNNILTVSFSRKKILKKDFQRNHKSCLKGRESQDKLSETDKVQTKLHLASCMPSYHPKPCSQVSPAPGFNQSPTDTWTLSR